MPHWSPSPLRIFGFLLFGALASFAQSPASEQPQTPPASAPTQALTPSPTPPRSIKDKVEHAVDQLEDSKMFSQVKLVMTHPNLHARLGGLGDGSGFGLGVEFSNNKKNSPNLKLTSVIQGTFREYMLTTAGVSFDPTRGKCEHLQLDFNVRYQARPQDNFYGIGPGSLRENRSNYDLQERGFNFAATLKLTKSLRVGAGLDLSSARVFDGQRTNLASTPTLFPNLPGFVRGATLLSPQLFLELDKRDNPGNTTKGVYAFVTASSNDSIGKGDFGFVNFRFDARGYLPLITPRHVLATRLIGNFNSAKGGSEIPFFRLARIGDTRTLRGYRALRFYDRNAIAANFEYRVGLTSNVGGLIFTDVGQVFHSRSQISAQNLRQTWGGGIEIKAKKSTLFRILVGKSDEGTRLIIGFGPTF